jgi:FkbM family methyltransferase
MSLMKQSLSAVRTMYAHPYNRRRPVFALYRLARWQFHKRWSSDGKAYRYWGTRDIVCYPDSRESMWLIYNYYMDWDEFHFIQRYVKNDSVVLDVGANIGIYTLWLSQYVGDRGSVIAFEPDPQNHQRCAENLQRNRLDSVRLEQVALSDRSGTLQFSVGEDTENHLLPQDAAGAACTYVEATTLDEYCRQHGIASIDFMKVDVEGAELMVLQGAANLLRDSRIGVLQLELNDALQKYGLQRADVVQLLESYGYRLYTYRCGRNELGRIEHVGNAPQNVYAIRDIDVVRSRLGTAH